MEEALFMPVNNRVTRSCKPTEWRLEHPHQLQQETAKAYPSRESCEIRKKYNLPGYLSTCYVHPYLTHRRHKMHTHGRDHVFHRCHLLIASLALCTSPHVLGPPTEDLRSRVTQKNYSAVHTFILKREKSPTVFCSRIRSSVLTNMRLWKGETTHLSSELCEIGE